MENNWVKFSIFMFINSGSGSGVGQRLKQLDTDRIDFKLDGTVYDTYFFNMRQNREEGFQQLKEYTEQKKPVIAVVCGGDGTVMWVVSQLARYQIDPALVPIAIIPLGTGNDFSRYLGWGKEQTSLTENNFQELKNLIRLWRTAQHSFLDIWEVDMTVTNNGRFEKVQNAEDVILPEKTIKKHFCNYFSFGIDGEIGYQFDKRRTKNRLGNLAVYGAMGIKSNFSTLKNIGELVEVMTMKGDVVFEGDNKSWTDILPPNPFQINLGKIGQNLMSGLKMTQSFQTNRNLLALNINSFMGGTSDIWKKAKDNEQIQLKIEDTEHSCMDKKIEIVSFSEAGMMGLEKAFGKLQIDVGLATKVAQGQGPFYIKFREYPNNPDHMTFFQIDGQFLKARHPKQVILQRSKMFNNSQIRVLKRNRQ